MAEDIDLGKISLTPKGTWNEETHVEFNDVWKYGIGKFLALKDSVGITPSDDGVNWYELSSQGLSAYQVAVNEGFQGSVSDWLAYLRQPTIEASKDLVSTSEGSDTSDLDIVDSSGNVLVQFSQGHIKTRNFDSANIAENSGGATTNYNDLSNKPAIDGHVLTKDTLSSSLGLPLINQSDTSDLDIVDSSGNVLVQFSQGHVKTRNFDSSNNIGSYKQMKILFISNSFGCDAFTYLPHICNKFDIKIKLGIAFYPWCSLKQHWENRSINFYTSGLNAGYWKNDELIWNRTDSGLMSMLEDEEWDMVAFLQNPSYEEFYDGLEGSYEGYQPYLDNLINLVKENIPNVKLAWQFSHPRPRATNRTTVVYPNIISSAKKVLLNTEVDVLIPNATAIENARTSIIKNIGGTNLLTSDDLHLDDRIGRLVAAHTWFEAVVSKILNVSSYGKSYIPPETLDFEIPNARTSQVYQASLWDCEIARMAARMAVANPYSITDMSSITF